MHFIRTQAEKRELGAGDTRGAVSMNTFEMKTAIHFELMPWEDLKDIPYKRVLVVTDPFVVKKRNDRYEITKTASGRWKRI